MRAGPRNLITDVAGLKVGHATDAALKSGTTVLVGDAPMTASVSVMGGAPGTRETDLLDPDRTAPAVDALVLSGGSAFGLAAAQGVMDDLAAQGRGFAVGPARVPIVPAAILFDLVNGGDKDWPGNPYPNLGRRALANASETFELGSVGAGTGASTMMLKGGLGSASTVLGNGLTVGALVAANPVGCVTTPGERHFWAAPFEIGDEFGGLGPDPAPVPRDLSVSRKMAMVAGTNTTIAIVATDAPLDKSQCKRLATAAQDGLARAIVPAHGPMDGDLVFAVSTTARQTDQDQEVDLHTLCHVAAVTLSRAIARAIFMAAQAPGDPIPTWQALNR